jgi:hypothetical protein
MGNYKKQPRSYRQVLVNYERRTKVSTSLFPLQIPVKQRWKAFKEVKLNLFCQQNKVLFLNKLFVLKAKL